MLTEWNGTTEEEDTWLSHQTNIIMKATTYSRSEAYALGLDGIVGLEYKIPEIPFAISLDMKPLIEIDGNGYFYFAFDPGFGLKFTF